MCFVRFELATLDKSVACFDGSKNPRRTKRRALQADANRVGHGVPLEASGTNLFADATRPWLDVR